MTKTVIVLAAGVGSRLRPLTDNIPKSLVEVGDTPLLIRFLKQVIKYAPDSKVVVVAGYLADQISTAASQICSDIKIVVNHDYSTTNNMESCRLGLEAVKYGDCVIVNADCIYDDDIVLNVIGSNESCIAIDSSQYIEENMKVSVKNGHVTEISKALADSENTHTSIDLYHFIKSDVDKLLNIMVGFNGRGDLNKWNEVAIDELVKSSLVKTIDCNGSRWMEVDDLNDLKKAEEIFNEI